MVRSATTQAYYDKVEGYFLDKFGTQYLNKVKDVVKWIEDDRHSPATRKSYLSVYHVLLKDAGKENKQVYDRFLHYAKGVQEARERQEPTEKDISFKTLVELQTDNPMMKVVLALYTMFPPRRLDYTPMKIVAKKPKDTATNYLQVNKSSMKFFFNEYKTASHYGQQVYAVPKALEKVLREWIKPDQTELFPGYTPTTFSTYVGRFMEKETGIRATVNSFRHAYITHLRGKDASLKKKQDIAAKMGHSVDEQELYRRV
jgi:hypothetical protein